MRGYEIMNAFVSELKNKILIDWFAMTTSICEPEQLIEMLGMENCPFMETYGARGWKKRLYFSGVSIHFDGHTSSTEGKIWLEMSGQGCRTFESLGHGDFNVLFDYVLHNQEGVNITRIDVAYDDFTGLLDLEAITQDTLHGNFVSKARTWDVNISSGGTCVTHGSKRGSVIIRIYDKAAERNRSAEISHWVRCEIMLRRERAFEFIKLLRPDEKYTWSDVEQKYVSVRPAEKIDTLYFLVLNHYLRYIDKSDTDSNVWRAPMAVHWSKFATSVTDKSKSLYVRPGMEYNALNLSHYVSDRNAGPIFTYIKLFGVNDLVDKVNAKAPLNLNPKYKMLLAEDEELKRKGVTVDCR